MQIENKKKCIAVVLSAGQGKRMGAKVQKQYIELKEKPIIYYTLKTFQDSSIIDEVILVVGAGQEEYVKKEIVDKFEFTKVVAVVPGGKERYDSVWEGLKVIRDRESYVFIHDGARMFVDETILENGYRTVERFHACVAAVPCKDTIKLVDDQQFAVETPRREYMWAVQTPQIFDASLIVDAYAALMKKGGGNVTDDAMVVEMMQGVPVKLYQASYENIKITTPEDLVIAEEFLKKRVD